MTILLVILIFSLLVFLHELGHFWAARRNGIEVEEFGFGFPPRVYGKRIGKTLYSINLLPLGGFVKLQGEDSDDMRPGSFGAASFASKTKVLLAGVGMNLLTAYVIVLGLAIFGMPSVIRQEFKTFEPVSSTQKEIIALEVGEGSPAQQAGIRRGDRIASINGATFEKEDDLVNFSREHADQEVLVEYVRDGKSQNASVGLRSEEEGQTKGYLGLTPLQIQLERFGIYAPVVAAQVTVKMLWGTLAGIAGLFIGLVTQGSVSEGVAGPVGIVAMLSNFTSLGISFVLFFVASISISLAALNALPVPALDGGRYAIIAAQKVFRRKLSPQTEATIHSIGFLLLLGLMVAVTIFDIKRL